ncbi:MAG: bifunctional demethylmenaquinone methyltransferase/2-methoxy-6-polyprenyl-1,4-benzoquinol methylase UbiE [Chlorobi bacterium]|nr:bifunctional demethylmenaquinone methyltransferase/2-methoxy-6-polyprenyl-1,4-benzoquinol methylase UbiE [Chlorobiota bacterium]
MERTVKPYDPSGSKKAQVREMFDRISPRYDFLNRLLSAGIDRGWRRKLVRRMKAQHPRRILDIATGTGDLALLEARHIPQARVTGLDISEGMLEIARKKIEKAGLTGRVDLVAGDAENLPFDDESFEAASVAFGVRNFEDLDRGLREIARILVPGGYAYILEFSQPQKTPFKQAYRWYSTRVLPALGQWISGDPAAYTYLPESIAAFPYGKEMEKVLRRNGFTDVEIRPLTFGIATLYLAKKPEQNV